MRGETFQKCVRFSRSTSWRTSMKHEARGQKSRRAGREVSRHATLICVRSINLCWGARRGEYKLRGHAILSTLISVDSHIAVPIWRCWIFSLLPTKALLPRRSGVFLPEVFCSMETHRCRLLRRICLLVVISLKMGLPKRRPGMIN